MSLRSSVRRKVNGWLARAGRTPTPGRVLVYHEVGDDPDPISCVPPALFHRQLEWLEDHGLRTVSVAGLRSAGFPAGMVGLSFDDGYRSAARACERVIARGWSATVFIVPGWIVASRDGLLGWRDLEELSRAGVEIAAHGWEHELLCGRPIEQMARLLTRARERIRGELGIDARGLAYPFGPASAAARRAAVLAGYDYACTSEPGRNDPATDPLRIRRNEILGTDDHDRLLVGKLSGSDDWMAPIRAFENARRCGP